MKTYTAEDMREAAIAVLSFLTEAGWIAYPGEVLDDLKAFALRRWPGEEPKRSFAVEASLALKPDEAMMVTLTPMPDGSIRAAGVKIVNTGHDDKPKRWVCRGCGDTVETNFMRNCHVAVCGGPVEETP